MGTFWDLLLVPGGRGQKTCTTNLVQTIAESGAAAVGLNRGQAASDGELAVLVGQVRRRLIVAAIRDNLSRLLTRLSLVGSEARQAATRRAWRRREDEMMRRERGPVGWPDQGTREYPQKTVFAMLKI